MTVPLNLPPHWSSFLQSNNVITTHFMIGYQILYYPNQFLTAFQAGHDIACHTWTHAYMTTLTNLQIVAEFGWTMQLIANSTGGRLPKFWRPPYGDTDVRVSAIAKEVFNLQAVLWNQDSMDYTEPSAAPIVGLMQKFLSGPKTPGLIVLEHELSDITVNGFIQSYNMIAANGWNYQSLAQVLGGGSSYTNAKNSSSNDVIQEPIVSAVSTTSASSSSSSLAATPTTQAAMQSGPTPSPTLLSSGAIDLWTSSPLTMLLLAVTIFLCS